MKSVILYIPVILFCSLTSVYSQDGPVAVTVYNANLGVIKETRNVNIRQGKSELKISDVAQLIDPTSVHIKLKGEVIEQNYQYDLVSMDKILQKYIDKEIQLIGENNELIEGTLLSVSGGQIVLSRKEGGLVMFPSTGKYRISVGSLPEGLITKPTLVWLVDSDSQGEQEIEISYQTAGMNWHAEYVAVLNEDDTRLDLNSWVSIENNSGTHFNNAKLKLVAGDVNLISDAVPFDQRGLQMEMMKEGRTEPQFEEQEFFEYHIYNLQRSADLANSETKQISLFEAAGIPAVKKFYYKSGGGYYYPKRNTGTGKVNVIIEFQNKEENSLGIPMPKGKVRLYKSDGETIEFIGEDLIDHTPRNEQIKLKIGNAFDIVVEEKQTESKKITDKVYEQSYEITLKNRKKEDVTVEVERFLGTGWEILSSSIEYVKKDAQSIVFNVPVKEDTETVLKFKVRYIY